MNIITLSGKQFCGKDTVAKILLECLPDFCRIGLADSIKLKYSEKTGLSLDEIEKNKSVYRADLIALGNEGRAINPDYWLNNIIEKNLDVVVPDVRMPHEIEIFKNHNAFCIRVEASADVRSTRGGLSRENDYTETALDDFKDWDYVIKNESDYETLVENVKPMVEKIKAHFNI